MAGRRSAKAVEVTEKPTEEKIIDISQFFSRENEMEGIWFEPEVNNKPTGIEFKVFGPSSSAASRANDFYNKENEVIQSIKDEGEKMTKIYEVLARQTAMMIGDVRVKGGGKLMWNRNEVVKENDEQFEDLMTDILFNSPLMAVSVIKFTRTQENFLG